MYTIKKFMIQLLAVEIDEPLWRILSGNISLGYTHTLRFNQSRSTRQQGHIIGTYVAWKPSREFR